MRAGQQRRDRIDLSEEHDGFRHAKVAGLCFGLHAIGAIANHQQYRRHVRVYLREHPYDIAHALDRTKVGNVHEHFPALHDLRGDRKDMACPIKLPRVDEIVNHFDVAAHAPERTIGLVAQILRDGRDGV